MKLVEILARELGEWPVGVKRASQDSDKEIRFDEPLFDFYAKDLADDAGSFYGDGAIVTRDEWEAERAKVEGKTEWNGEGLPPVGSVCEHYGDDEDYNSLFPVLILAHAKVDDMYVAVFQRTDDDIEISFSDAVFFHPIRTPDQIAAQEREDCAREMIDAVKKGSYTKHGISYDAAMALVDAGYRKQEQSE